MRRAIAVFAAFGLFSCKQYQPTKSVSNIKSADVQRDCTGKDILRVQNGSKALWSVTTVKDGKEEILTGSNAVSGFFEVRNRDLKTASGKFYFDAGSTDTGNRNLDGRIMELVFGLGEKMEFSFLLTGLKDGSLPTGSSLGSVATGTLLIDGQSSKVEFPVILTELGGGYRLETKGSFPLNMRAATIVTNGMNLVPEITQLLGFVPGMNIKDSVDIKLDINFANLCS